MDSSWKKINKIEDLYLYCNGDIFLARWNGRIGIAQFNTDDQQLYASFNPARLGQFVIDKSKWDKFDYVVNCVVFEGIEIDRELSCEYCNNNEETVREHSLSRSPHYNKYNEDADMGEPNRYNFYKQCTKSCPKLK